MNTRVRLWDSERKVLPLFVGKHRTRANSVRARYIETGNNKKSETDEKAKQWRRKMLAFEKYFAFDTKLIKRIKKKKKKLFSHNSIKSFLTQRGSGIQTPT